MNSNPKVGVIGVGMVGGPLARYLSEVKGYVRGRDLFLYDIDARPVPFNERGHVLGPKAAEIPLEEGLHRNTAREMPIRHV